MTRNRLALILLVALVSLFAVTSTALAENGGSITPTATMIRR
jgi:hypothetical protein